MRLQLKGAAIRVDYSFLFTFTLALLALGPGRLLDLPRVASELLLVLVVRELGHVVAWRALGLKPRVCFGALGGETTVTAPLARNLLGLLAGPLALLALGSGAYLVGLWRLAALAVGWGLLSLLPMRPMPGGRMLTALLERPLPSSADLISYLLSLPVALAGFVAVMTWRGPAAALVVTGVAFALAIGGLQELGRRARDAELAPRLRLAWTALGEKRLDDTLDLINQLHRTATSTAHRAELHRLAAWLYLASGQLDEAESQIDRLPMGYEAESSLWGTLLLKRGRFSDALVPLYDAYEERPSDQAAASLARALLGVGGLDEATRLLDDPSAGPLLFDQLQAALFYAGRFLEAASVGERSWAISPAPRLAFNQACTHARLGNIETALGWISQALELGWRDLAALDEDEDLAPLRARPEWGSLRARLTSLGRA